MVHNPRTSGWRGSCIAHQQHLLPDYSDQADPMSSKHWFKHTNSTHRAKYDQITTYYFDKTLMIVLIMRKLDAYSVVK